MDTRQMEELLAKMKEELGEDRFKQLMEEIGPDEEMQNAVDFFHLSFCSADHSAGDCSYYLESEMDNTWSRPSHKEWLGKAKHLIESYGLEVEEFLDTLTRITQTLSNLIRLSDAQCLLFFDLIGHEAIQKTLSKKPRGLEHLGD